MCVQYVLLKMLSVIYSPSPYFCEIGDLRIGPNCLGSPASTSWPPLGLLGSRRSVTGMIHSGSVAWPASSMKMCVKWSRGNNADTNLRKWCKNKSFGGQTSCRTITRVCFSSFLDVLVCKGENVLRCLHSAITSFWWWQVIFNHRHSVTTYLPAVTRVVTIMR